jgi:hypothetical protein
MKTEMQSYGGGEMRKYLIVGLVLWGFGPGEVSAAIKPCADLHREIATKLDTVGVQSYQLLIQDKDKAITVGKVVGTCENSSKKIVYIRNNPAPASHTSPVNKNNKVALQPNEKSNKMQSQSAPVSAIKPCADLHREIAAKLDAVGVKSYQLLIIDQAEAHSGPGKIVGRCENGTKRIRYIRGK